MTKLVLTKDKTPSDGARPRAEINLDTVLNMCRIGATNVEIAGVCGVSVDTFERRLAEPDFGEPVRQARQEGKTTLRRMQWQKAMEGDKTMLVWLGKQMLGQRDKIDSVVESTGTLTVQAKTWMEVIAEEQSKALTGVVEGEIVDEK